MCDSCNYQQWWDSIEDMLDDERYEFALDTLESIQEWIGENVTEKQIGAIQNIERAGERDE
jgi:hypothetical protein